MYWIFVNCETLSEILNTYIRCKQENFHLYNNIKDILRWFPLAPIGPEKRGCRMRIRDLFSKIRDLFSKFETYSVIRDYKTKKTAGAAEPPEPPSLAPMPILYR